MRSSRLTSFAAGALVMLVLGSGTAVAATGGKFILGRSNTASATTTLTNSKGTALSLKAPSSKPALSVSNDQQVPNLNSSEVGGLAAGDLARTAGRTGNRQYYSDAMSLDPASNGATDTLVAQALCPNGTILTGGGFYDFTQSGYVLESAPTSDNEAWEVMVAVDPTLNESIEDVAAYATCYNPKGNVSQQTQDLYTPDLDAQAALTPQLRSAARNAQESR
jgi:hypothetical protein